MTLIGVVIIALVFGMLAWHKPVYASAAILVLLPSYQIRFTLGVPLTLLEVLIFVHFAVSMWKSKNEFTLRNTQRILRPYTVLMLLWVLVGTLAVFVGPDLRVAAGLWKAYIIEPLLFVVAFVINIRSRRDVAIILWALGVLVAALGIVAYAQHFTGVGIPQAWQPEFKRRVVGLFDYPNALGLLLAPLVVLLGTYGCAELGRTRRISDAGMVAIASLGIAACVFAISQGALLGIGAGAFMWALVYGKWWRKGVIVALFLVAMAALIPQTRALIVNIGGYTSPSTQIRFDQWRETWSYLKQYPITGTGLGGYQQAMKPYHKKPHIEIYLYPHNAFLNVWAELGLAGLIVFVGVLIVFFMHAIRRYRLTNDTWIRNATLSVLCGFVALLVHGLVDVPFFKNDLAVLFWFFPAMMIVLSKSELRIGN